MSGAIRVEGLDGGYGGTGDEPTISDLTFSLPEASTAAVLGPNGGGKTTLLRALIGDLPSRSGIVEVSGRVAYVPQTERYRLDYPVSALDVVTMGTYADASPFRPLGRELRERSRSALAQVGLESKATTGFGRLSGGQRQRVMIARAIAQEARVLLLDEPMSGVDRPSSESILGILDRLRDEGRTIVLTTHDVHQARRFDVVLCVNSRLVYAGEPSGLTPQILADTYGGEMIRLDDGSQAVVIQHHDHDHGPHDHEGHD